MLNSAGTSSLLLLEDIDAAFTKQRAAVAGQQKLTFSGSDPDPESDLGCTLGHCEIATKWSRVLAADVKLARSWCQVPHAHLLTAIPLLMPHTVKEPGGRAGQICSPAGCVRLFHAPQCMSCSLQSLHLQGVLTGRTAERRGGSGGAHGVHDDQPHRAAELCSHPSRPRRRAARVHTRHGGSNHGFLHRFLSGVQPEDSTPAAGSRDGLLPIVCSHCAMKGPSHTPSVIRTQAVHACHFII